MLRRSTTWLTAVVLLHAVVACWFAGTRPIDADEGYYVLAAELVAAGQEPYTDFFYPQAPLLPALYAPFTGLAGTPQLPGLRLVSVAFSVLAVILLGWWARTVAGARWPTAAAALMLLAASGDWLTWVVTVKTYAVSAAGVALALLAVSRAAAASGRRAWVWALVGGVAMGLVASTRLLYGPAAAVPALVLAWRRHWLPAGLWLVGAALGGTPVWWAWLADAERFLFNNLHYHQLRFSELEDAGSVARASAAIGTLLTAVGTSPGLLLLLTAVAAGRWFGRRGRAPGVDAAESAGLVMAGVYTATCLLPDPSYRQYFTSGLPVMLWPAAAAAIMRWPARRARVIAGTIVASGLALVAALGWLRHDLPDDEVWQLDRYRRVCARIARGTEPGDVVFAFWPGYVAGADREPLPGMENQFAVGVSERLDAVARRRYHIAGRQELGRAFRQQTARMAVIGGWMYDINTALDDREMTLLLDQFQQHYELVEELDGVKLCRPLGRR